MVAGNTLTLKSVLDRVVDSHFGVTWTPLNFSNSNSRPAQDSRNKSHDPARAEKYKLPLLGSSKPYQRAATPNPGPKALPFPHSLLRTREMMHTQPALGVVEARRSPEKASRSITTSPGPSSLNPKPSPSLPSYAKP